MPLFMIFFNGSLQIELHSLSNFTGMLLDLHAFLLSRALISASISFTRISEKEKVDFLILLLIFITLGWLENLRIMSSIGSISLDVSVIYSLGILIFKVLTAFSKNELRVFATSTSSAMISLPSTKVIPYLKKMASLFAKTFCYQ